MLQVRPYRSLTHTQRQNINNNKLFWKEFKRKRKIMALYLFIVFAIFLGCSHGIWWFPG